MILSYVFLKTRYKLINVMGVLLTVIGIACLVFADFNSSRNNGGVCVFVSNIIHCVCVCVHMHRHVSVCHEKFCR